MILEWLLIQLNMFMASDDILCVGPVLCVVPGMMLVGLFYIAWQRLKEI